MGRLSTSSRFAWSRTHTAWLSVLLALVGYSAMTVLRLTATLSADQTISLADFIEVSAFVAALAGLVIPKAIALVLRAVYVVLPRPGALAYDADRAADLKRSFTFDRNRIANVMVPDHLPAAKPAKSAKQIDLGDALYTLSPEQADQIREFVGAPRLGPDADPSSSKWHRDILVVTGEPGGGKSVLIQELHATLAEGVERGYHSFVPVVLFARDLTLAELRRLAATSLQPFRDLLLSHYEVLMRAHPAGSQLIGLQQLLSLEWGQTDILVIVDGLDEIAQRSAYEAVQSQLAELIVADLSASHKGTHRYVLTCRVDEDLALFRGASLVRLHGLTDNNRDVFCNALVASFGFSRSRRDALKQALRSDRVVPSHVFGRNPYFLALLVRYLRDDEEHVRDQVLDFDFLMRRYLEREAVRPHAAAEPEKTLSIEERHLLFNELERLSRAPLQFLAFRSATAGTGGSLYDEFTLTGDTLNAFASTLFADIPTVSVKNVWEELRDFIRAISASSRDMADLLYTQHAGILRHLHENDVRIMLELAVAVAARTQRTDQLMKIALGRIRVLGLTETTPWYDSLSERVADLLIDVQTGAELLAQLLFVRGIVAAQVLRILNVSVSAAGITLRFRHRRLAEYYAACYARDRWSHVERTLPNTPWLGPVLNLTAALEGKECPALRWLVARVANSPRAPAFAWRYLVEDAVEAAFFSEPGDAYEQCIASLLETVLSVLVRESNAAAAAPGTGSVNRPLDPITQIVLFRAIQQIARLKPTFRHRLLRESTAQAFWAYDASITPEWGAEALKAGSAVEALAGMQAPWRIRCRTVWRLVRQPSAVVGHGLWRVGNRWTFIGVVAATVLSELAICAFVALSAGGLLYGLGILFGAVPDDVRSVVRITTAAVPVWWMLVRAQQWLRSPLRAAMTGSLLWRVFPNLARFLRSVTSRKAVFWRLPLIVRAVAVGMTVLAISLGGIVLAGYVRPDRPPNPCPTVDQALQRIRAKFWNVPPNAQRAAVDRIRLELRNDLDALRAVNTLGCGFKSADGQWTLAEDAVADELVARDARLIPARRKDSPPWGRHERDELVDALSIPSSVEPEDGIFASLSTIERLSEADRLRTRLQRLRAALVTARRAGQVESVIDVPQKYGGPSLDGTLGSLNRRIEFEDAVAERLRARRNKTILVGFGICLGSAMVMWLLVLAIQQRRDRRVLDAVEKEASVQVLCEMAMRQQYGDRVRNAVIARIDSVGVQEQDDLDSVERMVGHMYSSELVTDRTIAIRAATLARTLANRLRHRVVG